jgi:hypothetical protein
MYYALVVEMLNSYHEISEDLPAIVFREVLTYEAASSLPQK